MLKLLYYTNSRYNYLCPVDRKRLVNFYNNHKETNTNLLIPYKLNYSIHYTSVNNYNIVDILVHKVMSEFSFSIIKNTLFCLIYPFEYDSYGFSSSIYSNNKFYLNEDILVKSFYILDILPQSFILEMIELAKTKIEYVNKTKERLNEMLEERGHKKITN